MRPCWLVAAAAIVILVAGASPVAAHRSGCHRWHSCPSDHGTYVCGDIGHCSQCPDNNFCELGKSKKAPKRDNQQQPKEAPAKPERPAPQSEGART